MEVTPPSMSIYLEINVYSKFKNKMKTFSQSIYFILKINCVKIIQVQQNVEITYKYNVKYKYMSITANWFENKIPFCCFLILNKFMFSSTKHDYVMIDRY